MKGIVIIVCYLVVVNLVGFVMMGIDKHKARHHLYRIPEKQLFFVAIIGGVLGSLLGMYVFRHKTKHISFTLGMPIILVVWIILGILARTGKLTALRSDQYVDFAFDTVVTTTLYGKDAHQVHEELQEYFLALDHQLDWRTSGSRMEQINAELAQGKVVTLSQEEFEWLQKGKQLNLDSQGTFDLTLQPVSKLWDFQKKIVPTDEEVKKGLLSVGSSQLVLEQGKLQGKQENMGLELGSVGKGIACDGAYEILKQSKIEAAVIAVGGSVLLYGRKPAGEEFHVAIQDPAGAPGEYIGYVRGEDGMIVSTSGDYERFFMVQDKRYHHILDATTGYPAEQGVHGVTVISKDGYYSDALSTACFVLGVEQGIKLLEQYDAEGIFILEQSVVVTEGAKEYFVLTNKNYEMQ